MYSPDPSRAQHALPGIAGKVLVASHGSWNRNPWIGYRVDTFDIDLSGTTPSYAVSGTSILVPPLREVSGSGLRIRPVDLLTSPADGSLLMTADRDDFMGGARGGGLYRVAGNLSAAASGGTLISPLPNAADSILSGAGTLERLVALPCARQMASSPTDPSLLYVSSFGGFCPDEPNGALYVVELDLINGGVTRHATLLSGLHHPQGIDISNSSDGSGATLYIATSGSTTSNRGNCVLRLAGVDAIARARLGGTIAALTPTDPRLADVACGFTRVQSAHSWRSLRVAPSGDYAIVSVGADCNWPCEANEPTDLQTTLVRIDLQSGSASVAATGIRNAIGLHFLPNGDMLFSAFGSDNGQGIPGGGNGRNVPDCELNVLRR